MRRRLSRTPLVAVLAGTLVVGSAAAALRVPPRAPGVVVCPAAGRGGDAALNQMKNRTAEAQATPVTVATLVALPVPAGVGRVDRVRWSAAQRAAVAAQEARVVVVTGYLLDVKHQGVETANCRDPQARDYHLWLGATPTATKAQAVVVEVTPPVQRLRPGWTTASLTAARGRLVRVTGWVLLDQEHPEQVGVTRATLYEVHPVLHLEVASPDGTRWQRLDG